MSTIKEQLIAGLNTDLANEYQAIITYITYGATVMGIYREAGQEGFDAYTTLLLDALEGNRQHFLRFDEVEWAWRVLDPILKAWQSDDSPLPTYPAGSEGPAEAVRILDSEQHHWRPLRG